MKTFKPGYVGYLALGMILVYICVLASTASAADYSKKPRQLDTRILYTLGYLNEKPKPIDLKPITKDDIKKSLNETLIDQINVHGWSLSEFINNVGSITNINIIFHLPKTEKPAPNVIPATPVIDPLTGLPPLPNNINLPPFPNQQFPLLPPLAVDEGLEMDNIKINTGNTTLRNITLKQLLDIVCLGSSTPLSYSVTEYGILIYKVDERLVFRKFRLLRPYLFTTKQ